MATLQLIIDARGAAAGAVDFRKAAVSIRQDSEGIGQSMARSTGHATNFGGMLKHVFLAAGIGIGVHKVFEDLMEFETGLVRVGKATGVHGGELDKLGDDFIKLSTEIPVSTEKLLELGFAAGQLGVHGAENILAFTETVAKLGTTGNLGGEQAAQSLARILNTTREGFDKVKALASTIVQVAHGDDSTRGTAATEAQIARTTVKVTQAAAPFGLKSADTVALAASFASVGVEAQSAATTTGLLLRTFDTAARSGDTLHGKLQEIAQVAGMTSAEFQTLEKLDPAAAVNAFITGLGKIQAKGGDATQVLRDLGLANERTLRSILPLAKGSEDLANRLALARKEFANPLRLDKEADAQFQTLQSQLKVTGNTIEAMFLKQRGQADPLRQFVTTLNEALKILGGFKKETADTTPGVKALVAIMELFVVVLEVWAAIKIVSILNNMRIQVLGLGDGMAKATILSNPLLTAVLAVGVGLTAWTIGQTLFDQIKEVQQGAEKIRHAFVVAMEATTGVFGVKLTDKFRVDTGGAVGVSESTTHAARMAEISKDFSVPNQNSLGQATLDNLLGTIKKIKETIGTGLFGADKTADTLKQVHKQMESNLKATEDEVDAEDLVHQAVRKQLSDLQQQGKYIGLNNVERTAGLMIDKLRDQLGEQINAEDEKQLDLIRQQVALNARAVATKNVHDDLSNMRRENEMLLLNNDQRAIEVEYWRIIGKHIQEGVTFTAEYTAQVRANITQQQKLKQQAETINHVATGIGDAFGRAFEDSIMHAKSFGDVIKGLFQDIAQTIIHELVTVQITKTITNGLMSAMSGFGGGSGSSAGNWQVRAANGAAFDRNGLMMFAGGGIVNSPTMFGFNGGKSGLMGEAGPEAILPLIRGSNGKLGVAGGSTVNNYQTINISTPDANSFKRSSAQIRRQLQV